MAGNLETRSDLLPSNLLGRQLL